MEHYLLREAMSGMLGEAAPKGKGQLPAMHSTLCSRRVQTGFGLCEEMYTQQGVATVSDTKDGKVIVRVALTCVQAFVVSKEEYASQGQQALVRRAYHAVFKELRSVSERGVHAFMKSVGDQAHLACKAVQKGHLALGAAYPVLPTLDPVEESPAELGVDLPIRPAASYSSESDLEVLVVAKDGIPMEGIMADETIVCSPRGQS